MSSDGGTEARFAIPSLRPSKIRLTSSCVPPPAQNADRRRSSLIERAAELLQATRIRCSAPEAFVTGPVAQVIGISDSRQPDIWNSNRY